MSKLRAALDWRRGVSFGRHLYRKTYFELLNVCSNSFFRAVLTTPPMPTDPASRTILFTILHDRHCRAYLLGAKSLLRFCPPVRVVVQNDGSLSERSIRELTNHLPGIEILPPGETRRVIRERACRRLLQLLPPFDECGFFLIGKQLNVIYQFPDSKIILFDSDLLFLRNPRFVVDWVRDGENTCFHSDGGTGLSPVFRRMGFDFSRVDINSFNAGFIGFHNNIDEDFLCEILERIRATDPGLLGWWEIEQAIWSVLFNRMENPVNLDHVEKDFVGTGFWPYERVKKSVMVHFVSSVRFRRFMYLRLAREVVRQLNSAPERAVVASA